MDNKGIKEPKEEQNIDKDNDNAFNRINKIQLLIKKESYLYDVCKRI